MSVPSGLDFSNVRHVRVWHEQFEAIKNKGEFLIVEDKTNGKCVSFTRDHDEECKPSESYLELKKLLEDTREIVKKLEKKKENTIMSSEKFISLCKENVVKYFNENSDKTDNMSITQEDVYVVWYCKTLQNHKVLLSTNISDGMYYELTYNGDKNELYLGAYKKWQNVKIDLNEEEFKYGE